MFLFIHIFNVDGDTTSYDEKYEDLHNNHDDGLETLFRNIKNGQMSLQMTGNLQAVLSNVTRLENMVHNGDKQAIYSCLRTKIQSKDVLSFALKSIKSSGGK